MTSHKERISSDRRVLVGLQLTVYSDYVKLYVPDQPFAKHVPGYEKSLLPKAADAEVVPYETNEERSIRRTRKIIKDIVDCNEFTLFVTFTFNKERVNRFSVEECKRVLANWLKNQRAKHGKFKYLIVMEYHKNGAIHFHALFGGYYGKLTGAVNPHTGEPKIEYGKQVYNLAEYKSGHSTVNILDPLQETRTRTAAYIQKYLKKDMPVIFGKNRFWASQNLNRPLVIDSPDYRFQFINPDHVIPVDHGLLMYFEKDKVKDLLP